MGIDRRLAAQTAAGAQAVGTTGTGSAGRFTDTEPDGSPGTPQRLRARVFLPGPRSS